MERWTETVGTPLDAELDYDPGGGPPASRWKDDIRRQSDPLRGDLTHLVEAVKSLEANVTHSMETLHARLNEMVERQAAVEQPRELLRHIVLRMRTSRPARPIGRCC
jgi:uncharacterized coiled-coil protein SlyX